jgi:2'-5' RNA ligase
VSASGNIRSFVALDLDAPVLARVRTLVAALAGAGADVHWVRPAGLHITLKFLGAVEPARLERVHAAVQREASSHPVLRLQVRGLGAFPSLHRPRVIWAGLSGDGVVELALGVERALEPLHFAAAERPFTPHVTLGRVRSLRGWLRLAAALATHADDDCGTTVVSAVVLYRSTLHPEGAVYTPLWTIPLGRNKKEPIDDTRR